MSANRNKSTALRKRWIAKNPPDENGNYECWICHQPVHVSKMTVDHVAPIEQYPEYAKDLSNLRPSHQFCNDQRSTPKTRKILYRFGHHRSKRGVA